MEVCGGGVFALMGLVVAFAWRGRGHAILVVCVYVVKLWYVYSWVFECTP